MYLCAVLTGVLGNCAPFSCADTSAVGRARGAVYVYVFVHGTTRQLKTKSNFDEWIVFTHKPLRSRSRHVTGPRGD